MRFKRLRKTRGQVCVFLVKNWNLPVLSHLFFKKRTFESSHRALLAVPPRVHRLLRLVTPALPALTGAVPRAHLPRVPAPGGDAGVHLCAALAGGVTRCVPLLAALAPPADALAAVGPGTLDQTGGGIDFF